MTGPLSTYILLVHWHPTEAAQMADDLSAAGWSVRTLHTGSLLSLSELRRQVPLVFLISLRRLPSHGRQLANSLAETAWARHIPIIFVDGTQDVIAVLHSKFPHAQFCTWQDIDTHLERLSH